MSRNGKMVQTIQFWGSMSCSRMHPTFYLFVFGLHYREISPSWPTWPGACTCHVPSTSSNRNLLQLGFKTIGIQRNPLDFEGYQVWDILHRQVMYMSSNPPKSLLRRWYNNPLGAKILSRCWGFKAMSHLPQRCGIINGGRCNWIGAGVEERRHV